MLTRYKVGTIDHNRSNYDLLVGNGFFEAMFTLFRIAFRGWYGIKSKWPGAAEVVHTHRTSLQSDWPRGFGELNPSPRAFHKLLEIS